jgi:hypothetical protein
MLGVVNEFPVNERLQLEASYHLYFPPKVASKVTVPDPQTDDGKWS